MRYSIVFYSNISPFQNRSIPIGVVIQSEAELKYKFDLSESRFKKIKSINPAADPDTFLNFEKTFKESFIDVEKIEISDEQGNKIEINSKHPKFLDYLNETFLSGYTYTKPTPIESDDMNQSLDLILNQTIQNT